MLLRFIDDADDDVVFAACESLRKVGSEHDTSGFACKNAENSGRQTDYKGRNRKDCPGASSQTLKHIFCQLFT